MRFIMAERSIVIKQYHIATDGGRQFVLDVSSWDLTDRKVGQ
jgi:hypothetical protein